MKKFRILFPLFVINFCLSCGDGADSLGHNGVCDGYAAADTSDYILPYAVGDTHEVAQSNCSSFSHFGHQRYAYDFIMNIGTGVVAARAGTVIEVIENFQDGSLCPDNNELYVQHDDGTVAGYLHLTENGSLVAVGDAVTQGQTIALSGDTGCSTDPHLHFIVFADAEKDESVPVNFANTDIPNPRGLEQGKSYTAE